MHLCFNILFDNLIAKPFIRTFHAQFRSKYLHSTGTLILHIITHEGSRVDDAWNGVLKQSDDFKLHFMLKNIKEA